MQVQQTEMVLCSLLIIFTNESVVPVPCQAIVLEYFTNVPAPEVATLQN
jgi:hypothetical protein